MELLAMAFNELVEANDTLSISIEASDQKGWVCGNSDILTSALLQAYGDYWYYDDSDGRKTKNYHGLYLADESIVNSALNVNAMKTAFKETAQLLQKEDKQQWLHEYGQINSVRRDQLKSSNLTRLNLKQTYRHIPILHHSPDKIGFSWYTQGKSITKVTKQQAYDRLCKFGNSSHIQIQQQKLASLNDYEILAIVQKQAPLVRANIVYQNDTGVERKAVNSSLPFIIRDTQNGKLPEFNQINSSPPLTNTRLKRSDSKISEEVFLPSIRAYRYL